MELQGEKLPGSRRLNSSLFELAEKTGTGCVITNYVHYASKKYFPVHDILTCVRTNTKLEDVHPERRLNAENYLKSGREMAEIGRQYPKDGKYFKDSRGLLPCF